MVSMPKADARYLTHWLLKDKIDAATQFSKLMKVEYMHLAVNRQMNDYIKLMNASFSDDPAISARYQDYYLQTFEHSEWHTYINKYDDQKKQLKDIIQSLEELQKKYEDHYKALYDHKGTRKRLLPKDDFYKVLKNKIEVAKNFEAKLDAFSPEVFQKKTEKIANIIKTRTASLKDELPIKENVSHNQEAMGWIANIKARELYMHFREAKILISYSIKTLMEDLKDFPIYENELSKLEEFAKTNTDKINQTTNLDSLDNIYRLMTKWKEMDDRALLGMRLKDLRKTIMQCGAAINVFQSDFDSLGESIITQINLTRNSSKVSEIQRELMGSLKQAIETKNNPRLDEIAKSHLNELKSIQGVEQYFEFRQLYQAAHLDESLLSDIKELSYITLVMRDEKREKIHQGVKNKTLSSLFESAVLLDKTSQAYYLQRHIIASDEQVKKIEREDPVPAVHPKHAERHMRFFQSQTKVEKEKEPIQTADIIPPKKLSN